MTKGSGKFENVNKDSQKYQHEQDQKDRNAYLELEKERAKAIANQLDPSEETTADINQQFDEKQASLKSLYNGQDSTDPGPSKGQLAALKLWVGDDRNKAGFLEALCNGGHDVDNVSPEQLDRAYKEQLEKHKAKKEKAVAQMIQNRYISR
ncbi:hypothetical protein NF212_25185 [Parasalinivibrio latis]|uniref:hypothetical protein n=1 Tax=Parasalinivibrio latis TaxID=2952610 RepID=UPI0030DDED61